VSDLRNSPVPFTHLSFSNDGKLLLGVAEGRVFVLDAFTGSLLRSFPNGVTEAGAAPEASLSYDGQYVLSGGLLVWMVAVIVANSSSKAIEKRQSFNVCAGCCLIVFVGRGPRVCA
jgi:hypothetical protein